jgi:hypothetical protein
MEHLTINDVSFNVNTGLIPPLCRSTSQQGPVRESKNTTPRNNIAFIHPETIIIRFRWEKIRKPMVNHQIPMGKG